MPQNETQLKPPKLKTTDSDEAERKRREKALDEALENTFPASDPVSAEQPVQAHRPEILPTAVAANRPTAEATFLVSAKREFCPGYERSSHHSLCKDTVFLDLAL
jgi:hypothetical protein